MLSLVVRSKAAETKIVVDLNLAVQYDHIMFGGSPPNQNVPFTPFHQNAIGVIIESGDSISRDVTYAYKNKDI